MTIPERTCRERYMERELFLLELESLDAFPGQLLLSSPRFACLLACDASNNSVDDVSRLARKLLDSGAAYICCWGQIASVFTTSSMKWRSARIHPPCRRTRGDDYVASR